MWLQMCHGVDVNFDSDCVWQAIEAGDPRFDGWVFCGVKTTGIYCRPSCPARTPKRENVRFFAVRRGGAGRRLSRLQALPPGRHAGLARVGSARPIWSGARCV